MFLGNLILNYNLAILNNQIVLVLAKNCEKIFRYTVLPLIANENSCSLFVKSALTGALYSFSLIFSSNLRRSVRGQSFKNVSVCQRCARCTLGRPSQNYSDLRVQI